MRNLFAKIAKEILNRDIIDKTIDDFIIKNRLVGMIPLTNELKRKEQTKNGIENQ